MTPPPALALILARAGSKGVPGKNTAPIAGKPCIAWTIDYALSHSPSLREAVEGRKPAPPDGPRLISLLAVSTDDPAISDLLHSRYPSVSLVTRPPHLASDTARIDDAARHAVQSLESIHPFLKSPDTPILILYANIPVRPAGLIDLALGALPGADSVQSYQPVGKHHPWWTARLDPQTHEVRPWEGETLNRGVYRRQDLPPAFIPDGAILAVTRRALFLEVSGVPGGGGPHAFFGKTRRGIISPGPVIDIDSPLDLAVADAMLRPQQQTP